MNESVKFKDIQKILKYKFKDIKILENCFTHPSYYKDPKLKTNQRINEFERLEFLGDRVLGLAISSIIYKKFDKNNEGDLSKKLSYLVQKNFGELSSIRGNIDDGRGLARASCDARVERDAGWGAGD